MKYWEIQDPYYGLLKAETEEEARETYKNVISDLDPDDVCVEVSLEYAWAKFLAACENEIESDPNFNPRKAFEERPTTHPLLIDSELVY
ncbi:hypothetical protein [Alicyclobacillus suci]|uniref:hypothetical protein n=1 Tax=Alicyclobacillus suci TaxID=2816080 RepID=UPI001A8DD2CC|nr:hypothetical protein [Alicyclobacillus suci]